jgi:hypothetical protein
MAIQYARLLPIHVTATSSARRFLAYTARTAIYDPRLGRAFDYTHLAGDLAHQEILLPENCPAEFQVLELFAGALDAAELRKMRTPPAKRRRQQQVGLSLTIALPPGHELWLHEAAELLRRIVTAARGSQPIPIHGAIHEPPGNRHGHVLFGLRVFDAFGNAGPRLRDFLVHHRVSDLDVGAEIVEGVNWPEFVWELQQAFFHELGIDLVVDPIAPVPSAHFSPIIYSNGAIHNADTRRRVEAHREKIHGANVHYIQGSKIRLIEKLLRGRGTIRVAEIERLCARFFDHESERRAQVARILSDQHVLTLADAAAGPKRGYVTTRRVRSLMTRAAELIDHPGQNRITAVTGADHAGVVAQIAEVYSAQHEAHRPLILGQSLSECSATEIALAAYQPVAGTIDMAVTGPSLMRQTGSKRDICLRPGRPVIVPHAENIDDQRLARLALAVDRIGSKLLLGHDQSRRSGVVCRHLAAYAVDQTAPSREELGPQAVERLLRAGLVRRAIEAMDKQGQLEFATHPGRHTRDGSLFVVCDDPRRIGAVSETIRNDRVRSGHVGLPVQLEGLRTTVELSVGEWIVTTAPRSGDPKLDAGQFARIVAIHAGSNEIEIVHGGEPKRIDLSDDPAIRPAAAISIREAQALPPEASIAVELSDPRRASSALLLVAKCREHARLHVEPSVARTTGELIEAARRSLIGALPQHRTIRPDQEAEIRKILPNVSGASDVDVFEMFPDWTPIQVELPRPIAGEDVRHLTASNFHARLGYRLLHQHVGPHNPNHAANLAHALSLCSSELTETIARFLAGVEPTMDADHEFDATFDSPPELSELEPRRWDVFELQKLKEDLCTMTIPGSVWGTRPAFKFPVRKAFARLFDDAGVAADEL